MSSIASYNTFGLSEDEAGSLRNAISQALGGDVSTAGPDRGSLFCKDWTKVKDVLAAMNHIVPPSAQAAIKVVTTAGEIAHKRLCGKDAAISAHGRAVMVRAGTGPNEMRITNAQKRTITVGKFINGQSTTNPSAEITLRPGQTGSLFFNNGEAGFAAQDDASGHFQPNASRLEYEADANGRMKYPDISYIDGRNAAISLTDGAKLNKGDRKSIAAGAPQDIVSKDAGGNVTITGWYDGSTPAMRAGGAYMQSKLGTSGAYLHPNDDKLPPNQNPMSATQSRLLLATFGPT